jgi:hypothetical protein
LTNQASEIVLAVRGKTNRRVERRKGVTTTRCDHFQNNIRDLAEKEK